MTQADTHTHTFVHIYIFILYLLETLILVFLNGQSAFFAVNGTAYNSDVLLAES